MPSFGELLGSEICEAREALGWTQTFVAEKAFADDNPDTWEQYVRRIGDYENGKVKRPQVKVYQPLCDVLSITRRRIGELKAQAADAKSVSDDEIAALRAEKGSLEQALSDLRTLSRSQLETLAGRFEYARAYDATDGALIEYLTDKARDYRALKAQIETIDGRSNIKSAAQEAYEAGNFEEVMNLLEQVHSDELEEAANTAVTRAKSALMLNRMEQAYRILSASADSFAAVDPIEPARKRILTYFAILRGHGLTYGSTGIQRGIDLLTPCLTDELQSDDAWLWAAGQNALAIALSDQGERTDGPAGADLLASAVAVYRASLEVRTRDAHPVDWAMTQNNLANVLTEQGNRTDGPSGADLLAQAAAAFHACLELTTRDAHPVQWAAIHNNLGNVLKDQGRRTDGPAGADLLARAVAAYHNALEVRTRAAHPVNWAETKANLAICEEARSEHDGCSNPRPHLDEAILYLFEALDVFDADHMPYHFKVVTDIKTRIEAKLAALDTP